MFLNIYTVEPMQMFMVLIPSLVMFVIELRDTFTPIIQEHFSCIAGKHMICK